MIKGQDKLVLIGGSAGSLEVILHTLPKLSVPLPFPLVVVLHRRSSSDTTLRDLFANKTMLPVKEVEEKEPIKNNTIYLVPADYHTLIEKDKTFSLDFSEKVNFSRPSIDITFQTAAEAYESGVTAILLSGANADGTAGLEAVKSFGGMAVIQNPDTAEVNFMPAHALAHVQIDKIIDKQELSSFLNTLK